MRTFDDNELFNFVNAAMQYKADADVREGRSKEAFTPAYQVQEFLIAEQSHKKSFDKISSLIQNQKS